MASPRRALEAVLVVFLAAFRAALVVAAVLTVAAELQTRAVAVVAA
jgi:hypothetical protein